MTEERLQALEDRVAQAEAEARAARRFSRGLCLLSATSVLCCFALLAQPGLTQSTGSDSTHTASNGGAPGGGMGGIRTEAGTVIRGPLYVVDKKNRTLLQVGPNAAGGGAYLYLANPYVGTSRQTSAGVQLFTGTTGGQVINRDANGNIVVWSSNASDGSGGVTGYYTPAGAKVASAGIATGGYSGVFEYRTSSNVTLGLLGAPVGGGGRLNLFDSTGTIYYNVP